MRPYTINLCSAAQSRQLRFDQLRREPSVWRARDTFKVTGRLFGRAAGGKTYRERLGFANGFDA